MPAPPRGNRYGRSLERRTPSRPVAARFAFVLFACSHYGLWACSSTDETGVRPLLADSGDGQDGAGGASVPDASIPGASTSDPAQAEPPAITPSVGDNSASDNGEDAAAYPLSGGATMDARIPALDAAGSDASSGRMAEAGDAFASGWDSALSDAALRDTAAPPYEMREAGLADASSEMPEAALTDASSAGRWAPADSGPREASVADASVDPREEPAPEMPWTQPVGTPRM